MLNFKTEIAALYDGMIELRRDFHRHPELGLQEFRTAQIVEDYLKDLGLEVRRCCGTGVIGVLRGKYPGKTVLMRCDIDALPVTEDSGLPFSSENPGVMHACGHDGHAAVHLTTAKLMASRREHIHGTIVFLFQLNEEDAGAEMMIENGALDDKPDAVCGFHLWSPFPLGKIGLIPGAIMASSWYFKLTVRGKGGHGGMPHKAINPIDSAAHILSAIKSFHTLEQSVFEPTIITVCKFHAGEKEITVPEEMQMEGSIRCLHDKDEAVRARFRELCEKVCDTYRCSCEVEFKCGNSVLMNDPAMTKLAEAAAESVLGPGSVMTEDVAMMIGDDFAEFSKRVPGVYYFVGMRDEAAGSVHEHHSPHFRIAEAALPIAVEMEAELLQRYLQIDA